MEPYVPSIPPGWDKLTVDEYRELPSDGKRYQILDGVLDVTPAPVPRHQKISLKLEILLYRQLEERGLGEIYHAPIDVILDRHNVVQPDLVFIRSERLSLIGPKNIEGAPDLVVEILSPSTRRTDVLVKSPIYARFGIPSYWIVDPDLDRIEFFTLQEGAYQLAACVSRPAIAEPAAFPGLRLPLDEIFG